MGIFPPSVCLFSRPLTRYLWAQQESLQKTLENVKQELKQMRTSLAEIKRAFKGAREEWQVDKKTLEDMIVDIKSAETNLAKDRLTHESDAQAHEERVRVSAPFGVLRVFVSDTPYST